MPSAGVAEGAAGVSGLDAADWIQMEYPAEPVWESVDDEVLVQLVVRHDGEPSCAQSAIWQLSARRHPRCLELCDLLLGSLTADRWLRAGALSHLLTIERLIGFDRSLSLVDTCEVELLKEIVIALNYEAQGPLEQATRSHPVVGRVRARLLLDSQRVEFSDLFFRHFGRDI